MKCCRCGKGCTWTRLAREPWVTCSIDGQPEDGWRCPTCAGELEGSRVTQAQLLLGESPSTLRIRRLEVAAA